MNDTKGSIFRSARRFFSGTMLSRISGMLRDVTMAFGFGAQSSIAAFLIAFRFAHLLRRLLGEGALQSAFIPEFEKIRQEDPKRAAQFFRDLTASLSLFLSIIILVTMALLGGILLCVPLTPDNAEIIQLTLLMMPSLLFICLFGINASLLQCEKSYFTPGVAPVAFNFLWILGIIFLWNLPVILAMRWLAIFINLACIAQWTITLPHTLKSLKLLRNGSQSSLKFFSKDVINLLTPLSLGILGVGASQINNALDAVFARYADPQGPAYLWYAIRLQQLPLALFGIAISGAMLPPLSRAFKAGHLIQYREFLDFALRKSMALILPISAAIFVLGDSCINLIYGHGDFNQQAIAGTTLCLWAYGAGLFPMAIILIIAPSFYAQNDYSTPTKASLISIGLNIFLNYTFINFLHMGATSVAIATSISAWVNLFLLSNALSSKSEYKPSGPLMQSFLKIICVSGLGILAVLVFNFFFHENTFWILLNEGQPQWTQAPFAQLKILTVQTLMFGGTIGLTSYVLRADDLLKFHRAEDSVVNIGKI